MDNRTRAFLDKLLAVPGVTPEPPSTPLPPVPYRSDYVLPNPSVDAQRAGMLPPVPYRSDYRVDEEIMGEPEMPMMEPTPVSSRMVAEAEASKTTPSSTEIGLESDPEEAPPAIRTMKDSDFEETQPKDRSLLQRLADYVSSDDGKAFGRQLEAYATLPGLAMMGQVGLAQQNIRAANEFADTIPEREAKRKEAQMALQGQEIGLRVAQEDNDPSSPNSRFLQSTIKRFMPEASVEDLSAARLLKTFPMLANVYSTEIAAKSREKESARRAALDAQNMALRTRQLDIMEKRAQAAGENQASQLSAIDKEIMKVEGKEIGEWQVKNRQNALEASALLQKSLKDLDSIKGEALVSGGIIGKIAGTTGTEALLLSDKFNEIKQNIESTIIPKLRQSLGAQFTENEGAILRALEVDPKLSPEANLRKLKKSTGFIDMMIKEKDARSKWIKNGNDPLQYEPLYNQEDYSKVLRTPVKVEYSKSLNKSRITYDDGTTEERTGRLSAKDIR